MIKRLAVVIWYLSTGLGLCGFALTVYLSLIDQQNLPDLVAGTVASVLVTFAGWSLCFVLSGSFRRPPPPHEG